MDGCFTTKKIDSDFYDSTMTTTKNKMTTRREQHDGLKQQRQRLSHLSQPSSSRRRRHRKQQQCHRTVDVTGAMLVLVVILVFCFCPEMTMSLSLSTRVRHRHHRVNKNSRVMTMEMRMSFRSEEGEDHHCMHHVDDSNDDDKVSADGGRSISSTSPPLLPKPSHLSRRNLFQQFITSTSAAAVVTATTITDSPQPANAAASNGGGGVFTYIARPSQSYMPYEDFKTLLETDQLERVEFGIDGRSLVCLDTSGKIHNLKDMPDDRPLLKELYEKGVTVTLQEMKYEKKMNTINWFRDLVGVGDDLTDEELYEYRGYKTYRQNIPERSYVPANLITGYDLSRNMRK